MKGNQRKEKLGVSIGIALTAGMFSVIPAGYGAPVHDSASSYNTGAAVNTAGKVTTVAGNQQNNVVAWKDFSVGRDESVNFEGNKNYLNIVTGQNTSRIDGKISGGNEVYLVNPNGVIMGKDASVKTGSFYASTRYVDPNTAKNAVNAGNMSAVLDGSRSLASDIVNLGTIEADKVVVEGQNIRFLDSDRVKANSGVTFKANETDGSIHVGNAVGKTAAGYSGNKNIDYYQTIHSMAEVTDPFQNYMLADNITGGTGVKGTYRGKFDGMGFTITGMKTADGGLFQVAVGATIENVGVVDSTVSGNIGTGAIVGQAENTTLNNVFNKNTTITDTDDDIYAGGLVGAVQGNVSIKNSYNTGTVNDGQGNGIVGMVLTKGSTATIDSCYSTGAVFGGFASAVKGANAIVTNSYAVASESGLTDITVHNSVLLSKTGNSKVYDSDNHFENKKIDFKQTETVAGIFANNVSNTGGVTWDSSGNVSRPVWRIYEGQTLPFLTSQLKGTTTVDYTYALGGQTGNNNGADVKNLTYAAANMTASDASLSANAQDSSFETAGNVRDAGTKAFIYGSQDGWDIVGGTVTINKKKVSFTGGNFAVDREYDGTADATKAFINALKNGGLSSGGFYAEDVKDSNSGLDVSNVKANYDSKNVGNKTVTATGTITLNDALSKNYELDNGGRLDGITGITGRITPRTLYVTSNADGSIDKFYDGDAAVRNLALANGKSDLFELDESDKEHTKVSGDDVGLVQAAANNLYYVNADKNKEKNVVDGMSVKYTGLELKGADKDNYVLAYKDSQNHITGVTNNTVYLEGKINRRTISRDDFKAWKDGAAASISKVYDGNSDFKPDAGLTLINDSTAANAGAKNDDGKGILAGDKDKLHFGLTGTGKFYAADGTTETADASDNVNSLKQAKKVGYDVQVSADDEALLNNYQISDGTSENSLSHYKKGSADSLAVLGDGTITRRTLSVGLLKNVKDVNKTYDGTTAVTDGALIFGTDAGYHAGSATLTDSDSPNLKFTIKAAYDTKDVVRDNDRKVIANGKTIDISLGLDGDASLAGNYIVNGTNGEAMLGANASTISLGKGTGAITPRLLNVTFKELDKTFDNSSSLLQDNSAGAAFTGRDNSGVVNGDTLGVSYVKGYYADADGKETKNATNSGLKDAAQKIRYEGVSLTGKDKDNYDLTADAYDGKGQILSKMLTDRDISVIFADKISKVYDTSNSVSYDHTNNPSFFAGENGRADSADYIKDITIGGIKLAADKDYTIASAFYNSPNIDANQATYKFELTSDALKNFDLSQLTNTLYDSASGVLTKSTSNGVSITPKKLKASLKNFGAFFEKTYDGSDKLDKNQLQNVGTGNIIQLDGVIGNTAAADTDKINGRYTDKNVAYDANGNIVNKDILFDVVLTGSGSGNYVLDKTELRGDKLGRINPKELTADFDFTERDYKGSSKADAKVTGIHLAGVANGDNITLKDTDITGVFGSMDASGSFAANGDVNYDESAANKAGYKGVRYSGLQQALNNAMGTDHGNYVIADTKYYSAADQKGRINRLKLSKNDIEAVFNGTAITKEYDGTSAVLDPEKYFTIRTKNKIDGEYVDFKIAHGDGWAKYYTDDTYSKEQINVTNNGKVKFEVNGLAADDTLHNFDITGLTGNDFKGSYTAGGTITPRVLKVNLTQADGWKKTYDGTTAVKDAAGNVVNSFDYTFADGHDVIAADKGTVNVAVTGSYDDANAGSGVGITYTINLTGSAASNYKLEHAANAGSAATTASGQGDIAKRKLYVDYNNAAGASLDKIDKTYDGTKTVNNLSDYQKNFYVEGKTKDSGVVDADAGLDLDKSGIRAEYESPNVRYNGDNLASQDVTFGGFGLNDADKAKNYELVVRKDKGSGIISPKDIDVWVDNAQTIRKDYDGTYNLGENQAEIDANLAAIKNGIRLDDSGRETNVITGKKDVINLTIGDASYDKKDAGSAGLDYTLGWDNKNYRLNLKAADSSKDFTASAAGKDSVKVATKQGEITQRELTIDPNVLAEISKTYDSTTAWDGDAAKNLAFKNVIDGDVLNAAADAEFDDANAGSSKKVTYKNIAIGNKNYKLKDPAAEAEGKGTISKRRLYVDYNDSAGASLNGIDKTYDGTKDVKNLSDYQKNFYVEGKTKDSGIVDADAGLDLDRSGIRAEYESPNVRYDGDNLASQDVTFGGFGLNDADKAKNYELVVRTDKGSGIISPKDIDVWVDNAQAIRKDYDGTYNLGENQAEIDANLAAIKNGIRLDDSGRETNVITGKKDVINLTVGDASYDRKDAGSSAGLDYTLGWDNKNYRLNLKAADSSKDFSTSASGRDSVKVATKQGEITQRELTIDPNVLAEISKTYDGTTAWDGDAAKNLAFKNVIDGDVLNAAADAEFDDANAGSSKKVTYKNIAIGNKNYKLKDPAAEAEGKGTISKRKLYVDYNNAAGVSLDKINKTYDGTKTVNNLSDYQKNFYVEGKTKDSGIVDADAGLDLDKSGIRAEYESPDVRYDGDNLASQDVTFGGFGLNDADKAKNYELVVRTDKGSGIISPKDIDVWVDNAQAIRKDYDGTYNLGENQAEIDANLAAIKNGIRLDDSGRETNVITGKKDVINLTVGDASYDKKDAGSAGLDYTLGWDNKNYRLNLKAADSSKDFSASAAGKDSVKVSTKQGEITQRELTIDPNVLAEISKTYDGTTAWDGDAAKNLTFNNVIGSDVLDVTADAEFDDANAADSELENEKIHKVTYKNISIANKNYKLADPDAEAQGSGVIHRAGLTVTADEASIRSGEPLPGYHGTIAGWYQKDGDAYKDSFTFDAPDADSRKPGKYGIYGWYVNAQGNKVASGNVGKNYVFSQAAGNDTALTVEAVDPGREYHDTVNPGSQFRPDHTSYEQASQDFASNFNHGASTALEYCDANGAVLGTLTVSGDVDRTAAGAEQMDQKKAEIGIAGAEVINMDGAEAASAASIRIADSGDVVNLELESSEPSASAAVNDKEAEIAVERG